MATPSHSQAKGFYDAFGSRQDSQGFYENAAVEELIAYADFGSAARIFEFGCGTGRVAAHLLAEKLPAHATYLGVDISETMTALARRRLEPWSDRAAVLRVSGDPVLPVQDGSFDRVFSTYVTDLLNEHDIGRLLEEAHRVLVPDGLFCNAGLTHGVGPVSRLVMRLWQSVHEWRPALLGGCRPLLIRDFLAPDRWRMTHHAVLSRYGIASEVAVARKIAVASAGTSA